jgi:hypothetical protein
MRDAMRRHLPPWLRALTAEQGSREADFDWNEWVHQVWRDMRRQWTSYFVMVALFMGMFSCVSADMDAKIAASSPREKASVDPWALEKPVGGRP